MIDVTTWMHNFLQTLNKTFGDRVWFVGLQGSYGRGEATETSDIDIVVILDELSAMDIQTYNNMLDTLSHRELICGFLSGKQEIMNWEPSDLFQFCHDTTSIKGSLDDVMAVIDESAVNRAIKIGACNIFHGCVHNMLYEKSEDILRGLYKSAAFVVQAIAFKQTGNYISHQKELSQVVSSDEQDIVETFLNLKKWRNGRFQFDVRNIVCLVEEMDLRKQLNKFQLVEQKNSHKSKGTPTGCLLYQSQYLQAAMAAMAPSAAAVTTWRMFLRRQSPATKMPGVTVQQASSESK